MVRQQHFNDLNVVEFPDVAGHIFHLWGPSKEMCGEETAAGAAGCSLIRGSDIISHLLLWLLRHCSQSFCQNAFQLSVIVSLNAEKTKRKTKEWIPTGILRLRNNIWYWNIIPSLFVQVIAIWVKSDLASITCFHLSLFVLRCCRTTFTLQFYTVGAAKVSKRGGKSASLNTALKSVV